MSDINELFSRDPLSLTDTHVDQIIEKYREARHLFNSGAVTAKKKAPASKKPALNLDLDLKL
jgi:hypothetical protein